MSSVMSGARRCGISGTCPAARLPAPVDPEGRAVPFNDGCRLHQMGSLFPVIPQPCHDNPQQPAGVGEFRSWCVLLFDPSPTLGQLTLCREQPCGYLSPRGDEGPQKDPEVAEELSDVENCCVQHREHVVH